MGTSAQSSECLPTLLHLEPTAEQVLQEAALAGAHAQAHRHTPLRRLRQTNLLVIQHRGLPDGLPVAIDVVVCADVLEHVRRPELLLAELAPRLASGGAVIASIPNFGHWYPRLRTLFGRFDYDNRGILDRTHVRFFTRRSFERMAKQAGFTVHRVGATGLPFDVADRGGAGKVSNKLKPIRAIDRMLVKVRPQLFAYQFLYELKR